MESRPKIDVNSTLSSTNASPEFEDGIFAMREPGSHGYSGVHKALLVDDNVALLEVAATLFEQYGFEVLTAKDAAQAAEILRRTPDIEVLFSDVVMPGMSGIQLAYEARKSRPDLKIILVSGFAAVSYGSLNDFDFLRKPYRFSDVLKLLAKPR